MEVSWCFGKLKIKLTEAETEELLLQGKNENNQFLDFIFKQLRIRLNDPS